jgi:sulfite reductase beta subunit-like hemoprotein
VRHLEAVGLTTRRTGGNVVRGVVCCPLAGVAPDEAFDVTPHALAVDQYFRDAPIAQRLPRKVKIAFEGCPQDHARTSVADIGLRAALRNGRRGFHIVVGGGSGAMPMLAQPLEEFTPLEALFATVEAVLRVFDAHGNRQNRARARLKWLLKDWGIERFREAVVAERDRLGAATVDLPGIAEPQPVPIVPAAQPAPSRAFEEWLAANVRVQRQDGFVAVFVRCPGGELRPSQLRALATAARQFSGVRTTIEQDVLLRWVREETLAELYAWLEPHGLAACCAEQITDITRCVGAEQCLSAITNPKPAARAIGAILTNGLYNEPALRPIRIRISGCPNSCSHHHAADIGLYGASKKFHGRPVPHYALLLGGAVTGERFGQRVVDVPARRIAEAVERVLRLYLSQRQEEESFARFVGRTGIPTLRSALEDLTRVPAYDQAPEFYRDLDATVDFAVEAKAGECAA